MKVAILAGGRGTRLSEETNLRPKPMVTVGGYPLLWHIMKIYSSYGFNEFVVALGYLGEVVKDYFTSYRIRNHSLTVQVDTGEIVVRNPGCEKWTVHLLDTGLDTSTGGRVKQLAEFIGPEPFMLTYGDGVANIDISRLLEFHRESKRLVTVTAVHPVARFGAITCDGDMVSRFAEKPQLSEGWINGGFFVVEAGATSSIRDHNAHWECEPLERLVHERQVSAYQHEGFWQCMDTLRDVQLLNSLWEEGKAPWKVW